MIKVEAATDEELARFYSGGSLSAEWFGLSAKNKRLVVAFGGLVLGENGEWRAFLDLSSMARRPIMFRYAVRVMQEAKRRGISQVIATCDDNIPRSKEFLERLSFVETEYTEEGRKVYKWQLC